ncbi:MAG: 16S rRNA (adenine(1518)-N(6)/adenine(1519)-N(6))-dimethyltransferase RsmA [Mycoplasmoidaceae bacterium]
MNNKELINYLKKNNFIPSKKMGQNFLICNNYKKAIVDLLKINDNDQIIEIGPGFGALTSLIYGQTKNLKLIELDKRIHEYLQNQYPGIEIINNDILKLNLLDYCAKDKVNKVISNLPYSVSSKAIIKILKCLLIDESILMIQKEVAQRIIAKENSRNYNGFSVFVQLVALPEIMFDVPNTVFYPQPIVTSSIIKLTHKHDLDFDINQMEQFIRKCFNKKRKTIFNNLKDYYSSHEINEVLKELEIDKNLRPENISVSLYKKMYLLLKR